MPLLNLALDVRSGLRTRVRITVNRATLLKLRATRQPVPQPVIVDAMIDTGAERSCIDPAVVQRIALPLYAFGFASAPGTNAPVIPALGGTTVNAIYQAGLALIHPAPHSDLVVPEIMLETLPLAQFGIEAVIGRDVLASCVLVYNGPTGSATLAY